MNDHDDATESNSVIQGVGRGLGVAGRALGAGASALGQSAAWAYQSVDPDFRRQAFEAPVLGLMNLVPRPRSKAPSTQRDVLLVHGLAGHPSNFAAIQRYFNYAAGRPAYSLDLRRLDSLDAMALLLRDEIAARAAATPFRGVDLITHSMGGLVARLAMEDPATRDRVATLITMGTPHRGSHLARLATTPFVLDLRPDSPMMERLASQTFWKNGEPTRLIALWSEADTTVLPSSSAAWDVAERHHMEGYTHLTYLLKPASWRFLDRLLLANSPNLTA